MILFCWGSGSCCSTLMRRSSGRSSSASAASSARMLRTTKLAVPHCIAATTYGTGDQDLAKRLGFRPAESPVTMGLRVSFWVSYEATMSCFIPALTEPLRSSMDVHGAPCTVRACDGGPGHGCQV